MKNKETYNFIDVLTKTQSQMLEWLPDILLDYGYSVTVTDYMIMGISPLDNQVGLVAHLDTINTKQKSYYNTKYDYGYDSKWYKEYTEEEKTPEVQDILVTDRYILLSPEHKDSIECLGADDRVGVKTILDILSMGLKPHTLFTTDEEVGCVGSRTAVAENALEELKKASMLIQIDRGVHENSWHEMVTYSFDPSSQPEIFKQLEKTYTMATGSYTDVAVLGEHLDKPIVNVSASYMNEHHTDEFINLEAYEYNTNGLIKFIKWAVKQDTSDWKYKAKPLPKVKKIASTKTKTESLSSTESVSSYIRVPQKGATRKSLIDESGNFASANEYFEEMNKSDTMNPLITFNNYVKVGYDRDELLSYLDEAYTDGVSFSTYTELAYILRGYYVPDVK